MLGFFFTEFLGKVETHARTLTHARTQARMRMQREGEALLGDGRGHWGETLGGGMGAELTTHVYEHTLNISEEDRIRHTVVERLVGRLL